MGRAVAEAGGDADAGVYLGVAVHEAIVIAIQAVGIGPPIRSAWRRTPDGIEFRVEAPRPRRRTAGLDGDGLGARIIRAIVDEVVEIEAPRAWRIVLRLRTTAPPQAGDVASP